MNLLDDEIQKSLNTDIIRQVEETAKEFGVTDEKLIQGTSLALFIQHNKDKSNLLHISGDSYHNIKLENYLDILQQEGFQNILEIPFHSNQWNYDDVFYIFWHPQKFILLELDSYNKKSVNGAKFYFNWVPNNLHDSWNFLHSGGFSESSCQWGRRSSCAAWARDARGQSGTGACHVGWADYPAVATGA